MVQSLFVVGIGASAGGLQAIQDLFSSLPNDTGLSFIVIQHLSPNFKSLMPELLKKNTGMNIRTAEDGMQLEPNHIYFNKQGKNLLIKENRIRLEEKDPNSNLDLPINKFFENLASNYGTKSFGIILSGTGSDGTNGIRAIKEHGGTVIVQDPESAQFDGMPNSAIYTNLVDLIYTPKKIALYLSKLNVAQLTKAKNTEGEASESFLIKILKEIEKSSGINFVDYKRNTIIRRIEKRMGLNGINQISDYYDFIKDDNTEKSTLVRDLLIGVTSFFRDPDAFNDLEKYVISKIFTNKEQGEKRIWVAGCSTGEEAYSIAMLIENHLNENKLKINYKIFASDLDPNALEKASEGIFSIGDKDTIKTELFDQYFKRIGDKVQVIKKIRDRIVFSKHNLLKDPPFIRTDLVSCRNLLIYLNNKLQQKALMNFQFSLNFKGYLFLGKSESINNYSKGYSTINSKSNIYQNIAKNKKLTGNYFDSNTNRSFNDFSSQYNSQVKSDKNKLIDEFNFHKYLSVNFAPSAIFFDEDYNILFIKGDQGKFLKIKEGYFDNNLLNLLDDSVSKIIRASVNKLNKDSREILVKGVNTLDNNNLDIYLNKVNEDTDISNSYLLRFENSDNKKDPYIIDNDSISDIAKDTIESLEIELAETKRKLNKARVELETSNEELQTSNEELMSSNEELQSTNEELQSVNEELYTVNFELQEKNKELVELNTDINNIINSTEIGTLLLDTNLNIRKFTPAISKHFNLKEDDIGRPINIFAPKFGFQVKNSLEIDAKKVLESSIIIEKEIYDENHDKYYFKKLTPFITENKQISGVVISFVDITQVKLLEKIKDENIAKFNVIADSTNIALWELSIKNKRMIVNENWKTLFGLKDNENSYYNWLENIDKDHKEATLKLFDKHLSGEIVHYKQVFKYHHPIKNKPIWVESFGKVIELGDKNETLKFVGISMDITENKNFQLEIEKQRDFVAKLVRLSPDSIIIFDHKLKKYTFVNNQFHNIFGFNEKDLNEFDDKIIKELIHPDDQNNYKKIKNALKKKKETVSLEYRLKNKSNKYIWCLAFISPYEFSDKGELLKSIEFNIDITAQKNLEKELIEAKRKAETANVYKNNFLANLSHEIRTPMNGIIGFSELLKENNLSKDNKEKYTNIISQSSHQLLRLINDIIDISKIESGDLNIINNNFKIDYLFRSLEDYFTNSKLLENKSPEFKLNYIRNNELLDLEIYSDEVRIKQILFNLIHNAIKFTKSGSVEFGYSVNNKNLELYVKDTGIGIPESEIDKLFQRFTQITYIMNTDDSGVGLGLAIVKGIVDLLGGKVSVKSKLAMGSTFFVQIPFRKATKIQKDKKNTKTITEKIINILIAEDDIVNQEYLKIILDKTNFNITLAENGEDAIKLFKENNYDLTLLDIRMPEKDGFDVARELREIDPEAKIIFQTAYAMASERKTANDMGVNGFITKPIDKNELLELITSVIED